MHDVRTPNRQKGLTTMTTRNDAAARAPGFPELREQPVQQSVRQYLIEGPELFACSPLSGRSEFVSQRP